MSQKRSDESRPLIVPQFRAGRGLIGWSQSQLAEKAGLSLPTVKRVELETTQVSDDARAKMRKALEAAGVEFIPENGGGAGVRLRKHGQDRNNLHQHIERLEGEVAHLKPAASGKPSPATGMAMLRRGLAKSDLANAKNKQAKAHRK